jgi:hypothetical protein
MSRDWFLQELNLLFVAFIVMRRMSMSAVVASAEQQGLDPL